METIGGDIMIEEEDHGYGSWTIHMKCLHLPNKK